MRRAGRRVLACSRGLAFAALVVIPTLANGAERVDHVSSAPFADTIKKLEWAFGGHGLTVLLRLDFGRLLEGEAGPRECRMFEVMRRAWGKSILESRRAAGLAVPVRVYVYERDDGRTVLSYYRPSGLLADQSGDDLKTLGRELDATMDEVVRSATR